MASKWNPQAGFRCNLRWNYVGKALQKLKTVFAQRAVNIHQTGRPQPIYNKQTKQYVRRHGCNSFIYEQNPNVTLKFILWSLSHILFRRNSFNITGGLKLRGQWPNTLKDATAKSRAIVSGFATTMLSSKTHIFTSCLLKLSCTWYTNKSNTIYQTRTEKKRKTDERRM